MEDHPALEGRVTARLARRLVAGARQMTVNAAAKPHQVSWGLVNALVVAWAGLVGEHRRRRRCRVLLVDETSIRKRHRYVTVLVNGDTGEVLAMVPHRDSAALSGFLAAQGPKWCRRVKVALRALAWGEGVEQGPVWFAGVQQDSGAVVVEVGVPERHALDELGEVVGCLGRPVGDA